MDEPHTTAAVQQYLDELVGVQGDSRAELIVRALLARSVDRLRVLCTTMLYRSYPRLTRPPLNLQADELLSALVERLLKAMQKAQPQNVRQFFALANQHMRWELNDLARRLDEETPPLALPDAVAEGPASTASEINANARRMLQAIESLPDEEREVFGLVRIQGMAQTEAANVLGCSTKTIQRRLNRGLMLLSEMLSDIRPEQPPPGDASHG